MAPKSVKAKARANLHYIWQAWTQAAANVTFLFIVETDGLSRYRSRNFTTETVAADLTRPICWGFELPKKCSTFYFDGRCQKAFRIDAAMLGFL